MNSPAYFFTAAVTQVQKQPDAGVRGGTRLQSWDSLASLIIYGAADAVRAQEVFEDWCRGSEEEGEQTVHREIKRLVGAQVVEQLLAESGSQPIDWAALAEKLMGAASPGETAPDAGMSPSDQGEGFWVDVEQTVSASAARLDVESLKGGLPEDMTSALNWSLEKQFIFLISVLSPPTVPAFAEQDFGETESNQEGERDPGEPKPGDFDEAMASLPQMRELQGVALVEARNSVVAAWLWRKYAAGTPLASNEILIAPCCALVPAE